MAPHVVDYWLLSASIGNTPCQVETPGIQGGLEDKILLVITGEFGRSGLDKNGGRHHHPKICPLVFAGGGLKHGQVIGESDRRGSQPATQPITIDDLHATILHALFDVGGLRLDVSLPPKVQDRVARGSPIRELF